MPIIHKLRHEHATIFALVRRLDDIVGEPSPPSRGELFNLRRELASTLIGHLKAEDWALYPQMMASGDPQVAATAKTFSDEMGGLAAAFNIYAQRWEAMSIDQNWSGFCHESKDIIAALTARITRENRDLYPLAERLDEAA